MLCAHVSGSSSLCRHHDHIFLRFSPTFKDCAHGRISVSNHRVSIKQEVIFQGIISISRRQHRECIVSLKSRTNDASLLHIRRESGVLPGYTGIPSPRNTTLAREAECSLVYTFSFFVSLPPNFKVTGLSPPGIPRTADYVQHSNGTSRQTGDNLFFFLSSLSLVLRSAAPLSFLSVLANY